MRVVIAGGSGVVGKHLVARLRAENHSVTLLSRSDGGDAVRWSPNEAVSGDQAAIAAISSALDGADAVVNLAGASLGEGRLDAKQKEKILNSRLDATNALAKAHFRCSKPPPIWLQASAIGYYGNAGQAVVDESAPAGRDFLSDVCLRWEATARTVESRCRLIIARIGFVLAQDAPAWKRMRLPISLGVGGPLGSGEQWVAWIDADDLAAAMLFLISHEKARGVFNVTAPEPVRQGDIVRLVAHELHRPAFIPTPAFALRLLLGEAADLLILSSCRAVPSRLTELGFVFAQRRMADEAKRIA